jgi:hypothetical protein
MRRLAKYGRGGDPGSINGYWSDVQVPIFNQLVSEIAFQAFQIAGFPQLQTLCYLANWSTRASRTYFGLRTKGPRERGKSIGMAWEALCPRPFRSLLGLIPVG